MTSLKMQRQITVSTLNYRKWKAKKKQKQLPQINK